MCQVNSVRKGKYNNINGTTEYLGNKTSLYPYFIPPPQKKKKIEMGHRSKC